MALLDIFTGNPAKEAAQKQRDLLNGIMLANNQRIGAAQSQGLGALESGKTGALSDISSGIGTARGDIQGTAIDQAIQALTGGAGTARADLLSGRDAGLAALQSGVGQAAGAYDPLRAAAARYGLVGGQASDMLANALGLRGGQGAADAAAAFQKGPGYDFALNQGLESILRNANASGMAAGGNALREAQTFGQGLGNQTFQQWLQNLAGVGQTYSPLEAQALGTAGSGQANAFLTGGTGGANLYSGTAGRLADLASGTGTNIANVLGQGGRSLADLAKTGGLASAGVETSTGQNISNLLTQLAQLGVQSSNQLAPNIASTYGTEAAADMQGSANIWNALGKGISFLGSGGLSGLGSSLSGAKSLFS